MPSNSYKIFQAKIVDKDTTTPRTYTVVQIPEGYRLVGVQLPNALKDQSAPLLGSVVLVLQLDVYRSYILSILREPFTFLDNNEQFRGFIPDINENLANPIQDGEIFMEATGTSNPSGTPGLGAHLYLGNNGCAQIESGSMGERLIIGGTSSDDDHEVLLSADNGFFEGNPNPTTLVQTTINFDSLNNLTIGNQLTVANSIVTIPIAEMTIDGLGNIELFNTAFGTGLKLASLVMDSTGGISISSGIAGVPKAAVSLESTGIINMNSGILGAARITDLTLSSNIIDLQYWLFISAIQSFFVALSAFQGGSPVLQSQLGALGAAFLLQSPVAPSSLTSKITTGSNSVLVGG